MSEPENWEGLTDRECNEHRTVGPHRAWCFDDGEWCYPTTPCRGCELPALRADADTLRQARELAEGTDRTARFDDENVYALLDLLAPPTGDD